MTRFDAIVIGAGVNGLAAATLLARRGKSVCLVEQADRTGGMATLGAEDGPALAHLLHNFSPLVQAEMFGRNRGWPFRTTRLPSVSLCERGGHVVLRGGRASHADGSPHPDADACLRLVRQLTRYGELLRQLAEAPPPGAAGTLTAGPRRRELWRLARFGLGVKRLGKTDLRRFLQILLSNAHDLILDAMPDGPLAGLLAADAVRGAAMGPRSPGTVLGLIYRLGHGGEVLLPTGGMPAVFDALTEAAQTAGCRVTLGTRIARILVEADTVTGVETAAGEVLTAPLVLTSAGPMQAARMTGIGHFDIEALRRIRNIRARGTAAKVDLRLDRRPDIPHLPRELHGARLVHAPGADYVETAFNPSKYREMSADPVIEAVIPAPEDPSSTDAPVWLSAIVQYAPSDLTGGWTEHARARLLQITLDTLARVIPDLNACVGEARVTTPDRIEAATGAPGGHWHHAEMSLDQVLTLRPANGLGRNAMGPRGLFLCGASSHPGGDIMGLAGLNAARAALEAGG